MDGAAAVSPSRATAPPSHAEQQAAHLSQSSHSLAAQAAAERRKRFVSLWKRGNVYLSYLTMDGIRYAQSTGTGNRRRATLIEQHFREELNLKRHQVIEPTPQMSFGELAARFLTEGSPRPWHIDRLKLLLPYWSEVPIGRIHKSMTDDYRRRRHAAKTVSGRRTRF
jgi:hypothetical protein